MGPYRSGGAIMRSTMTWHVVTSQGGVILGVFGEAILSMAQECARKVSRETGLLARVEQVKGARPSVGTILTKKDQTP